MTEYMVRKQIYLPHRQNKLLKQLAKQRGVSEAEIIRQALEREAVTEVTIPKDSKAALEEIITFALSLRENSELNQGEPYIWNRDELYTEREGHWLQ